MFGFPNYQRYFTSYLTRRIDEAKLFRTILKYHWENLMNIHKATRRIGLDHLFYNGKDWFFFTKNKIYKRHCLHQPKWIYIQNYFWSHWQVCERMRLLSRFSQSNTDLLMQLFHLLFIHNFRQNLSYTFFGWDANNNNKKNGSYEIPDA